MPILAAIVFLKGLRTNNEKRTKKKNIPEKIAFSIHDTHGKQSTPIRKARSSHILVTQTPVDAVILIIHKVLNIFWEHDILNKLAIPRMTRHILFVCSDSIRGQCLVPLGRVPKNPKMKKLFSEMKRSRRVHNPRYQELYSAPKNRKVVMIWMREKNLRKTRPFIY